ncbi:hypothetical protein NNJEOMEG_03169 [Fundidesulfovibrio magnetotacticus]|uniref:Putative nickel insertion protein n=1 Tax=Fundidesulfovibrio magnetotacticus TaxID=2730080 RepID=A0A6V8LWN5_9BACT|nr:nickel pincer cofactor biosynthesis protein LarC [Fundidesulfovibrio magnetotacticus]GFK95310.1 hypothetical protein NNJEOMEG_03169 [Fundidesulfovibrio magnetotacticus]
MNILYYDCFAGLSGDMNLAAMIGLGVDPDHLRAELSKLGLDHEFELRVGRDSRHGIHGVRVDVVLAEHGHGHANGNDHDRHDHEHHHGHEHEHGQGRDEHQHAHGHEIGHAHAPFGCGTRKHAPGHGVPHDPGVDQGRAPEREPAHGHARNAPSTLRDTVSHTKCHAGAVPGHAPHRNLAAVEAIIRASGLSEAVKRTSLDIFRRVAEAEATVHGKPLEEVHFHEVGATDSLVDIVGAAVCFHALGVDAVWAAPVELGGGFVRCAHGLMPVPAPATAEILRGVPTTRGAARHEATTPTGAAIVASLASRFTASPAIAVEKTAYGIGHREADIPNVLRVHLARAEAPAPRNPVQAARLLQCNIDDMTGEALGVAMDLLMEQGAMDVHFAPIQMKKNRPATCVSLLCAQADEERFKELIFRHTTTLGVKSFPLEKTVLAVSFETLETPLGPVTLKNALLDGKVLRSKPELEDCRELARRHGVPLAEVYAAVHAALAGRGKP